MSSTETNVASPDLLPLKQVAELLVKHLGIHEGLWDVAIEIQAAIGQFGLPPTDILPGAMFRISRIGLTKTAALGPITVNAAEINPQA